MIEPTAIAQGVVQGYATSKAIEAIDNTLVPDKPNQQEDVLYWLQKIHEALAPEPKENFQETFQLMPYPSEYIIPDDFHGHSHVCVFFFGTNVPVRFDGVYGGTYTKTIGPGWFQLDVPGRLSVNGGSTNFPVIVSYRDDVLGGNF